MHDTRRLTAGVLIVIFVSFAAAWTGQHALALATLFAFLPILLLSVHIPAPLQGPPANLTVPQFRLLVAISVTVAVLLAVTVVAMTEIVAAL